MGHIEVEIWPRWVPPVNRRGRSTILGLDDSVRGFLRETECESDPLSILRHGAQFCLLPLGVEHVRSSQRLCGPPDGNQAIKQPASQRTSQSQIMADVRGEKTRFCRVQASRGRALAQTLCARSGRVPELFPQPESVNMILLLSRTGTLLTLGRESLAWAGTLANSGDPSHHQSADSRQHRGERSAGMLEMSRRVGGAESRCQAQ